jgi:type I restriction-modification system DNA methylase subunit
LFEGQEDNFLSYKEASEILGISVATLNNWVKANYVYPDLHGTKARFSYSDIETIKQKLSNGELARLNSRANKSKAKATFIPKEHLPDRETSRKLEELLSLINKHHLDKHTALLLLSLRLLKSRGFILNSEGDKTEGIEGLTFKNDHVRRVIEEWVADYGKISLGEHTELLSVPLPALEDMLGVVYQSLLLEGEKAQNGSYYTPAAIVNLLNEQHRDSFTEQTLVLDPCCGTGQFLLAFAKYIQEPANLRGYDLDRLAVHIARVNLLLAYPDDDFFPGIYCQNALYVTPDVLFDIVVTNPPWGFHFSKEDLAKLTRLYPYITSKEAFSYFLAKSLELLKPAGKLSFVLPEAILKIRQHSDIREHILDTATITSIRHHGNIFAKVLSPAIILSLEKRGVDNHQIAISNKTGRAYKVNQARFRSNMFCAFDTEITDEDSQLIAKIYQKEHTTLANNADWALGIVTGNNEAYLSAKKSPRAEGVLRGSDIRPYYYNRPSSFLVFEPSRFQQTAPEWKYRAKEKLIYKFISSNLVFAYDDQKTLTLNSANILLPRFANYPTKLVLAFLNSTLFQYVFKKKCNTIKILRGDLETLPFPLIEDIVADRIVEKVDRLIAQTLSDIERVQIQADLDEIIFSVFGLSAAEMEYIQFCKQIERSNH